MNTNKELSVKLDSDNFTPTHLGLTGISNASSISTTYNVDDLSCTSCINTQSNENEFSFDSTKALVTVTCKPVGTAYAIGMDGLIDWTTFTPTGSPGKLSFKHHDGQGYLLLDADGQVVSPVCRVNITSYFNELEPSFNVNLIAPSGQADYYKNNPHPAFPQSKEV